MGASAVLGPIIAGFLISADIAGLTWRPIFLINIVLGDLAPHLPADHRRHELHAPGGVEVEAEADIQADPAVTLLVKGQRLSGTARIIPPPDPGYGRL
jgi:MFS family permease